MTAQRILAPRLKALLALVYTVLFLSFLGLPFAFLAFGSDIESPKSNLYPFQSTIRLQDDFVSGGQTSGTIGSLGWSFSGGTITQATSSGTNLGLYERATGAVSGTVAPILLFGNSTTWNPALGTIIIHRVALGTNDANTTMRIGAGNSLFASPVTNGIFFEKLDGDTNWFCITRAASVETRTDSGVAIDTSFHNFRYVRNSSGVAFSIDGVNVCTHTTNIPGVYLNPGHHIVNSAAASKTYTVDYFQIQVTGLSR